MAAVGVVGVAGCLSLDDQESTTADTELCDANYERVAVERGSVTDELDGLVLGSNATSVQPGAEVQFTLTNESPEANESGNRSKYDVQRRSDGDWRSIFWEPADDGVGYSDELVSHSPGEGFTWEFTMDPVLLSTDVRHGDGHRKVCDPLQPGSYRFVFFGKTAYDEEGPETVLGTRFDVDGS